MSSPNSNKKIFTVLGGSGYVGNRCIMSHLRNFSDIKIYIVARNQLNPSRFEYDHRSHFTSEMR